MLSHTVEYALRAMIFLASMEGDAVNCHTVADRTRVPRGYLSKVMRDLVLADLVHSFRGPRGGFILARPAGAITLLDVVNAVEPMPKARLAAIENPLHAILHPLHDRIEEAMAQIEQMLRTTTLGAVAGIASAAKSPTISCTCSNPPFTQEKADED